MVTDPIRDINFGKWLFRACVPLDSGVPMTLGFSYLAIEQFWGRAVRASRDSLNPGRFLFVGRILSGDLDFASQDRHPLNFP